MAYKSTPHFSSKAVLIVAALLVANMSDSTEICSYKQGFPGPDFKASVTYDVLTKNRIRLGVLVEEVGHQYEALLDVYYSVPDDFQWSTQELYRGRYELSAPIFMDVVGDLSEADIHVSTNFSNIVMRLALYPSSSGETSQACAVNYQILVLKGSLDLGVKRGFVGEFEKLQE